MRKVSHLIGAEMLHNLYERHWSRINSIYFRHTIVTFKDGMVESYAPVREWTYLQRWVSAKFISLDPILLREIEAILHPSYEFVHEVMSRVDDADLKKVSNEELALLLIDIMDFPLGEIYKLNVVQIEYGLNFAIHKILEQYEPNVQDRNELLARLISPGELTVSQEEEVAFSEVVRAGRKADAKDPRQDSGVMDLITAHYAKFSPTHCAYGEEPPQITDYIDKYTFLFDRTITSRDESKARVLEQREKSEKLLEKIGNEELTVLCHLMAKIGVFRDWNKAKLGETVIRRLAILDEISRRAKLAREDINLYLLAELTELLDSGKKVSSEVIADRRLDGVSFMRSEDVVGGVKTIVSVKETEGTFLKGICASSGVVSGVVKIILDKEDIVKVDPGDIMVAVGTDFDLLEIMNLSSGIITEEGGLLSHASVVSRELKKPCLIGVANATKLLSDGDRITLDAAEGVITILTP